MAKKKWGWGKKPGSTEAVEQIVGVGQGGCNEIRKFIDKTDPATVPNVYILAMDLDATLLEDRFMPKSSDPTERADESRKKNLGEEIKDPDANLWKWIHSGRFQVIHLCQKTAKGEETQKAFGAGGDPDFGKKILEQYVEEIEAVIKGKDLGVFWGCGGGGTGTPGMRMLAEMAKRLGIHFVSIMIAPFAKHKGKVAIANELRIDLRNLGPLQVIQNEYFSKEERNIPTSKVYDKINDEILPIFDGMTQITQVVGKSNNIDLRDIWAAMKNPDFYISQYKVGDDGVVDATAPIAKLLNPPLQDKGMRGEVLFFIYKGACWTEDMCGEIERGVQRGVHFPKNGLMKTQDNEDATEPSVTVICFGTFGKMADKTADVNKEDAEKSAEPQTLALPESTTPEPLPVSEEKVAASAIDDNSNRTLEATTEFVDNNVDTIEPAQTEEDTNTKKLVATPEQATAKSRDAQLKDKYGIGSKSERYSVNGKECACFGPQKLHDKWAQAKAQPPNSEDYETLNELRKDFRHYGPKPDMPVEFEAAKFKPKAVALAEKEAEERARKEYLTLEATANEPKRGVRDWLHFGSRVRTRA